MKVDLTASDIQKNHQKLNILMMGVEERGQTELIQVYIAEFKLSLNIQTKIEFLIKLLIVL